MKGNASGNLCAKPELIESAIPPENVVRWRPDVQDSSPQLATALQNCRKRSAVSVDWGNLKRVEAGNRAQWNDSAKPFPYCVWEGALELDAARQAAADFATAAFAKGEPRRIMKHDYRKRGGGSIDMLSLAQQRIIADLNSDRMLAYLEGITGIKGLVADPDILGGGVHEILPGGFLNVHTDFNVHPKLKMLRTLNLIVYLNEDWREEWEGHLELWDEQVRHPIARIAPLMNRAALFQTNEISYHGHPTPLACPQQRTRKSFALYYYTPWPSELVARIQTNYQLVPWQWAKLISEVAELVQQGIERQEMIEAALIERYQSADITTARSALFSLKTWSLHTDPVKAEPKVEMHVLNLGEHREWRPASVQPNDQLRVESGRYVSTGPDPFLFIEVPGDARAIALKFTLPPESAKDQPKFYFDFGNGSSEALSRVAPVWDAGTHAIRIACSHPIKALRFDPMSKAGEWPDFDLQISAKG